MTIQPTPEDCETLAAKLEGLVVDLTDGEREVLARVINFASVSAGEEEVVSGFALNTYKTGLGASLGRVAVEGRSGVEVARQFGVTPNAVYLARGRVLARLREELADLDR